MLLELLLPELLPELLLLPLPELLLFELFELLELLPLPELLLFELFELLELLLFELLELLVLVLDPPSSRPQNTASSFICRRVQASSRAEKEFDVFVSREDWLHCEFRKRHTDQAYM